MADYPISNKSDKADKRGKTAKRSGFFTTYGDNSPYRVLAGGKKTKDRGNITVRAKSGVKTKGKDNSRLKRAKKGTGTADFRLGSGLSDPDRANAYKASSGWPDKDEAKYKKGGYKPEM